MVALIGTSLWSGDQSTVGDSLTSIFGGVVSTMVTVWVAVPRLLEASRTDQVTGVGPKGKSAGASFPTGGREPSQVSVAVALPRFNCVPLVPEHSSVRSAGAVTIGLVVSATVIFVLASAYWPNSSMTLN